MEIQIKKETIVYLIESLDLTKVKDLNVIVAQLIIGSRNPQLGIELLTGNYTAPNLKSTSYGEFQEWAKVEGEEKENLIVTQTKVICNYVSFDPWNNMVTYNYIAQNFEGKPKSKNGHTSRESWNDSNFKLPQKAYVD